MEDASEKYSGSNKAQTLLASFNKICAEAIINIAERWIKLNNLKEEDITIGSDRLTKRIELKRAKWHIFDFSISYFLESQKLRFSVSYAVQIDYYDEEERTELLDFIEKDNFGYIASHEPIIDIFFENKVSDDQLEKMDPAIFNAQVDGLFELIKRINENF